MDPFNFEGMSEEEIKQLIELGVIPGQQSELDKQYADALALRNTAGPEMRGNARVQSAANPLEFIGTGLKQYAGKKQLDEVKAMQEALRNKQTAGREAFLQRYLMGGKPAPVPGVGGGQVPAPAPQMGRPGMVPPM